MSALAQLLIFFGLMFPQPNKPGADHAPPAPPGPDKGPETDTP